jgi:hypothetical protein
MEPTSAVFGRDRDHGVLDQISAAADALPAALVLGAHAGHADVHAGRDDAVASSRTTPAKFELPVELKNTVVERTIFAFPLRLTASVSAVERRTLTVDDLRARPPRRASAGPP